MEAEHYFTDMKGDNNEQILERLYEFTEEIANFLEEVNRDKPET